MKVDRFTRRAVFRGEEGAELAISYDCRGEPFREGISIRLELPGKYLPGLFLESAEACELRNLLNRLYPPSKENLL